MDTIFKRPFLWPGLYRSPAELSISFLLDEKSTVVPVRLAVEQSGGKRKVSYGDARSNSERAALLNCPIAYLVGLWAKLFLDIDLRDASPLDRIPRHHGSYLRNTLIGRCRDPFFSRPVVAAGPGKNPKAQFWFNEQFTHGQLARDYRIRLEIFFLKHL
jgi:hypothetical protein